VMDVLDHKHIDKDVPYFKDVVRYRRYKLNLNLKVSNAFLNFSPLFLSGKQKCYILAYFFHIV
jgi:hypothetical protein